VREILEKANTEWRREKCAGGYGSFPASRISTGKNRVGGGTGVEKGGPGKKSPLIGVYQEVQAKLV